MNEFYAADPGACQSVAELRTLLGWFGPFTGRYLAHYPTDWSTTLKACPNMSGELETQRVATLLRRARERLALLERPQLDWEPSAPWIDNALALLKPTGAAFDLVIGRDEDVGSKQSAVAFGEYEPPATAEERIKAHRGEFVRVSRTLLLLSPELIFVDPFLDPLTRSKAAVLDQMLAVAANGRAQKVTIYARASEVGAQLDSAEVHRELNAVLRDIGTRTSFLSAGRRIELRLVDDSTATHRMHARYLLSAKGGIRFDMGFTELTRGRRMDVTPISEQTLDDLLAVYLRGKSDLRICQRVSVQ